MKSPKMDPNPVLVFKSFNLRLKLTLTSEKQTVNGGLEQVPPVLQKRRSRHYHMARWLLSLV